MCASGNGLVSRMQRALDKEVAQWDGWTCKGLQKGEKLVTYAERDLVIRWLIGASAKLNVGLDSMALTVVTIDRILFTTKVQKKYLQCLAVSSFYLACKICEEIEAVPPLNQLVELLRCYCTVQELVRMERVILKRLHWDLSLITPYTFFQLMLAVGAPHMCQSLTNECRRMFEVCFASYDISSTFRPSIMALAAFSILLENRPEPNWSMMTSELEDLLGIQNEKHMACRDRIMYVWQQGAANNNVDEFGVLFKPPNENDGDGDKHRNKDSTMEKRQAEQIKRRNHFVPGIDFLCSSMISSRCESTSFDEQFDGTNVDSGEIMLISQKPSTSSEQIFIEGLCDAVNVLYGTTYL